MYSPSNALKMEAEPSSKSGSPLTKLYGITILKTTIWTPVQWWRMQLSFQITGIQLPDYMVSNDRIRNIPTLKIDAAMKGKQLQDCTMSQLRWSKYFQHPRIQTSDSSKASIQRSYKTTRCHNPQDRSLECRWTCLPFAQGDQRPELGRRRAYRTGDLPDCCPTVLSACSCGSWPPREQSLVPVRWTRDCLISDGEFVMIQLLLLLCVEKFEHLSRRPVRNTMSTLSARA
jgi:hypothetical protein